MKIQVIELDPEDDHASVRDKVSRARADKVVLVWPRRGSPLNRDLDLKLVQRHTQRLGVELGLLTFDPEVMRSAERLHIPVFESLDALPPGSWDEGVEPPVTRPERNSLEELREAREVDDRFELDERGRWIPVALSIAAVVAIAVSILPSAQVVVRPESIPLSQEMTFWVDPSGNNRIPGHVVSTEISGRQRSDTSGRVRLPKEKASGEVEITNLTGDEILIPAGTGLRAGETRFTTLEDVTLEPSEGFSAIVAIEAADAGTSGNVAAGAIDSVEGAIGFTISVLNPERTSGGSDQVSGAVTMEDQQSLRDELELELLELAESALVAQLEEDFELIPGSLRIAAVTEERFDFQDGEAAESLGLELTLEVEGMSYSMPLALEHIEREILASLSNERQLVPASLTLEATDAVADWPAIQATFAVEGALAETIELEQLRRSISGKPKQQAVGNLTELLDLEQDPSIRTTPSWMPWVPWLGMRIDVIWEWENAGF